jgi:signal transduction histidine kinase
MRERALIVGASLQINSTPTTGTEVTLTVPTGDRASAPA